MGKMGVFGGILVTVGTILMCIPLIDMIIVASSSVGWDFAYLIYLVLPLIALIAGILAMFGKVAGGILAFLVGINWLSFALIYGLILLEAYEPFNYLIPLYSSFDYYFDVEIWEAVTIELLLILGGSVLATAGNIKEIRNRSKFRTLGGSLAIISGALMLVPIMEAILTVGWSDPGIIFMILFPIIVLFAGLLALAGMRGGGILGLAIGGTWLVYTLLVNFNVISSWVNLPIITTFDYYFGITIWGALTIEATLLLVGSILATAGNSDSDI